VLATIADQVSPRILWAPARLDDAAHEVDGYFTGQRHAFDLSLDLQLARVVRSGGSAGGYVGGAQAKKVLLTLEAAA